jgi:hypothetical protein
MDESLRQPALFSTFIMGLASAALIELGVVEDPQTKQKRFRQDQARSHIDLLAMLQEKTVGNLTAEEKELLERVLVDLRLQFAKTAR